MLTDFVRDRIAFNSSLFGVSAPMAVTLPARLSTQPDFSLEDLVGVQPFRGMDNFTAICWSAGLESSLLAATAVGHRLRVVHVAGAEQAARSLGLPRLEPVIIHTAAAFGARSIMLGLEYSPEYLCKGDNRYFSGDYMSELAAALDVNILQPFNTLDKYSLYLRALDIGLWFNSCNNFRGDPDQGYLGWCGECYKCFQMGTFHRIACESVGTVAPPSLGMQHLTSDGERWLNEMCVYLQDPSGPDPVLDNWSIRAALLHAYQDASPSRMLRVWDRDDEGARR